MSTVDVRMERVGRDAMIYAAGIVISRAASFVMLPVYTHYLSPAEYGILQLLEMSLEIAAIVLAAGITIGLLRFYYKAQTTREKHLVFSSSLYLVVGGKAIGTAALLMSAPWISTVLFDTPAEADLVRIAAVTFLLQEFTLIPMALMQAQQRAKLFSATSVGRLVLQLSLNIALVVGLGAGIRGILISSLVTSAVFGLLLGGWMLRQTGLGFSRSLAKRLLRFGLPYKATHAGLFIATFGDRYFLKAAEGLASVGLYGLAYQFAFLLSGTASEPILRAWNPQRFAIATDPPETRDRSYNRGFIAYSTALVSLAVAISLYVRPVLMVMSPPAFHSAANFVPVLLAAQIFLCWAVVVEFGIQVSERTEYSTYATWVSVGSILVLYALLIPRFGGMGAAVATLISATLRCAMQYHFSQRLWPVKYQWAPHFRLLAVAAGVVVLDVAVVRELGFWAQIGASTALLLTYGAAVWSTLLSREDQLLLLRILRSRIRAVYLVARA
jgi:O-antigen/teichoic acid export membrane protein